MPDTIPIRTSTDPPRRSSPGDNASGSAVPLICGLALVTTFIVYGSLFPFVYHRPPGANDPFRALIGTWQDWDGRSDLLSNILLYMPFGFLATRVWPPRAPTVARVALAILAGAILSACMECAQFYDEGRVSTLGDVYANAIGATVGATASALIGASMQWPFVKELNLHPDASLLLAAFLGYRVYPYMPVIDLHKYLGATRGLLEHPIPPPGDLARFVVIWLFVSAVIESLYGFGRWVLLFPLLAAAVFAGRIAIVDLSLAPADVEGAAIAFIVWAGLLHWLPGRQVVLACLVAGLIAALRLEPFGFSAVPLRDFGWVPFWSMMHGSVGVAIQAFLEKFYQYGGLIWLLRQAGLNLITATLSTAALLLATSYAEIYLPDRSSEVTDAAMALTIGLAFHLLDLRRRGESVPELARPDTADGRH